MKRLYVSWLLVCLAVITTFAGPAFREGRTYRFACLKYTAKGGIAPGSAHSQSYALHYNNTDDAGKDTYWHVEKMSSGYYTLRNEMSNEYLTFVGASDRENRYVNMTSDNQGTNSEWDIVCYDNAYYVICRPDDTTERINVRASLQVGTYSGGGFASNNEQFAIYDDLGNSMLDVDKPVSEGSLDGVADVTFGFNAPVYDNRFQQYMYPVTKEEMEEGAFSTVLTYAFTSDYAGCTLRVDGQDVVSGEPFVFDELSGDKKYTLSVLRGDNQVAVAKLVFTSMPVIEVNGTFSSVYSEGTFRVVEAEAATAAPLYKARIRHRGATASTMQKKSYAVKLIDNAGNSIDASFCGMRLDNNWILDAMAVDPARMRNRVSTDLWNDFSVKPYHQTLEPEAHNGTRGLFAEVILNGQYNGIYCFTEKIDRKQLKLKKCDPQHAAYPIRGVLYKSAQWSYEVLMGHYLGVNSYPYNAPSTYYNTRDTWSGFEFKYPDLGDGEPIDWAPLYNSIKLVAQGSVSDFQNKVGEYFDLPVFRDYYLLLELLLATDNHGKNMYLYAYNKNTDTRLGLTPWDLDGTWGRRWNGSNSITGASQDWVSFLWANEHGELTIYKRLRQYDVDNWNDELALRYAILRKTLFDPDALKARFAAYTEHFLSSGAAAREVSVWNRVNNSGLNFEKELDYISSWIDERVAYLDDYYKIDEIDTSVGTVSATNDLHVAGGNGCLMVDTKSPLRVPLLMIDGRLVRQLDLPAGQTEIQGLRPGIYMLKGHKVLVK